MAELIALSQKFESFKKLAPNFTCIWISKFYSPPPISLTGNKKASQVIKRISETSHLMGN